MFPYSSAHRPAGLPILLTAVALLVVPPCAAETMKEEVICLATGDDAGDPNAIAGIGFGARTFGGFADDRGVSVAATPSGSFVVGGHTTSFGAGGRDLWILHFDSAARLQSEYTVGVETDDHGGYVAARSNGNHLMVGQTGRWNPTTPDGWLVQTGDFYEWGYPGDAADSFTAIEFTSDRGVILSGRTESFGAGTNGDMWVVKLEEPTAGALLLEWQVTLGSPEGLEKAVAIQPTSDNGYIVLGPTTAFASVNLDLWLVKLDSTGSTIVWQKTYGGSDIDLPADVIESTTGELSLAGSSYSFGVVGASLDAWVARLDASGGVIWQYAYGTATDDYVRAISETSDGGLVVVGSTGGPGIADPTDAWIMKLGSSGEILWQKRFLGTAAESETFSDVVEPSPGSLVAVGRTESYGVGGNDLLLVALDLDGNLPRCDVLADWTATRQSTAVVPVDSWDEPVATSTTQWLAGFSGAEFTSVERDMCNPVALLQLARSGQITSYNPRDDGDLRPGVAWPDPRFHDNDNGTVTDLLTGLTWLKDANCALTIGWDPDSGGAGSMVWDSAVEFANEVNADVHDISGCASYSAEETDWRLANIVELETLMNCGVTDPAAWLFTAGFENVHAGGYGYWSSTTYGYWDRMAFRFDTGESVRSYWSTKRQAWLVRGGQEDYPDSLYPANAPKTGQAESVLAGDDGDQQRGVLWPVPRFYDHGDGTVTDELTGLRWLKDANCFGASSWDNAFSTLAQFNADPGPFSCADYVPSDLVWRLPNRKELLSLIEYLGDTSGLPTGHPFVNTSVMTGHWTSTTVAHRTDWAWNYNWTQATASMFTKNVANDAFWPVVDTSVSAVGAGRLPDDALFPGTPLTIAKPENGVITLNWGESCIASDVDYVIYEGTIPDYAHYGPFYCNTGGLTTRSWTYTSSTLSTYYLVVPINDTVEGSYGLGAGGAERGRSVWPCVARQNIAVCP